MAELTKDEAQLLAAYRAIKALELPELVGTGDVGEVLFGIEVLGDLKKREGNYTAKDVKAYLQGVVAGVAAERALNVPPAVNQGFNPEELPYEYNPADETVAGGPTGGVVAGQGEDPKYVTQTGPREDQEVE